MLRTYRRISWSIVFIPPSGLSATFPLRGRRSKQAYLSLTPMPHRVKALVLSKVFLACAIAIIFKGIRI